MINIYNIEPLYQYERTYNKLLTQMKNTSVLLVCIHHKGLLTLSHDYLHNLFAYYGKVFRVTIPVFHYL